MSSHCRAALKEQHDKLLSNSLLHPAAALLHLNIPGLRVEVLPFASCADACSLCRQVQPVPKKRVDPKAYMDQLKRELPGGAYEGIRAALKRYKAGKDSNALIDSVVDLLRQPGRHHLLSGFTIFLPKEGCAHFRKCIRSATELYSVCSGGQALIILESVLLL